MLGYTEGKEWQDGLSSRSFDCMFLWALVSRWLLVKMLKVRCIFQERFLVYCVFGLATNLLELPATNTNSAKSKQQSSNMKKTKSINRKMQDDGLNTSYDRKVPP